MVYLFLLSFIENPFLNAKTVIGKTMEDAIGILDLDKDSGYPDGGFCANYFWYCRFSDNQGRSVYLWLDVEPIHLPNNFGFDVETHRRKVFLKHLDAEVTSVSIEDLQKDPYAGMTVADVVEKLGISTKHRSRLYLQMQFRRPLSMGPHYLLRIADDGLIYEFHIPVERRMSRYRFKWFKRLVSKPFDYLQVYTGGIDELGNFD